MRTDEAIEISFKLITKEGLWPILKVNMGEDTSVYSVWRLMMVREHQGKGHGREAMRQVVEHVRIRPSAEKLDLSYVPGDGNPSRFYQSLVFIETGEMADGERVMRLDLINRMDVCDETATL
ncbi:MAG: GNAT family N-acetyltransferase [Anaerolineales bacterium]|nr:GNAT family N-acetyltransferase [Anaerolineales bacterium]